MKLATNIDSVPAAVNKYLLPSEDRVITVHQHPAVLIKPVALLLPASVLLVWLNFVVIHHNNDAKIVIWVLWAILLSWVVGKIVDWYVNYFVVTPQRMLLAQGILVKKVNMMPLTKVTDMSFQRSPMGQILGYGEFIVESAGQDQALSHVTYLPYPEQLYLEVCGLLFEDKEERPD
jgi:membrane protein YdbS with pleckstrin-like domain